jgi:hypothetical protein
MSSSTRLPCLRKRNRRSHGFEPPKSDLLRTKFFPPHQVSLADYANHVTGVIYDWKSADVVVRELFRNLGHGSLRVGSYYLRTMMSDAFMTFFLQVTEDVSFGVAAGMTV